MWELDDKEGYVLKNWCFWPVVLEKTLESPLDCKVIKPANPKGNQFWIFIGRTCAEAETPILWPPDAKYWHIGKDPDVGKDWRQEEDSRGWDGWMASPTQWTWVWVNSRSLLKLMPIMLMKPSNRLILCCPLLLLSSIFSSIRVFSNESVLHI